MVDVGGSGWVGGVGGEGRDRLLAKVDEGNCCPVLQQGDLINRRLGDDDVTETMAAKPIVPYHHHESESVKDPVLTCFE